MKREVFRIAALALLAIAMSIPAAADECGPLKMLAQVNLYAAPDGRAMFVPVKLQNQTKYMLLDTGGFLDLITPATVSALGLQTHQTQIHVYDVVGNSVSRATTVPDFAIGNLTGHDIEFVEGPSDLFGTAPFIAGILGPGILRNYDVAIDFGARTLTLISQDHCEGKVIYWPANAAAVVPIQVDKATGHIAVPVNLDGQTLTAFVDTGAYNSALDLSVAEDKFNLKPGDMTVLRQLGDKNNSTVYRHTFKSLSFEGLSVANPTFDVIPGLHKNPMRQAESMGSVMPESFAAQKTPDLLIGMDVLRHLHIYIAYKEQKLYITPTSAPTAAARAPAPAVTRSPVLH